nr:ATP-binding cassette domain-containing protein [Pseudoalteromonas sp. HF66]
MEVKNISHSYFRDGELVLKDISFSISKGEKVAIVGASGSGKTTLMNLLLGFIKPQSGSILVNGSDISTYAKEDIRKCFGIVPQKSFLFNMSVKDNISISKLDMNEQDIIKAAKIACIHSDIEKMPMKYESIVGEGGDLLSGGQKQRLCIARALVNNPDILFLDEATSSLDSESEKNISKNLECLNNAQLIIAHRMSTVVNCDKILVLNNGELVNIGKHSELLEKCNIYRKMISNQNLTMN